jgi:uncharacterized protein (DUF433 family)
MDTQPLGQSRLGQVAGRDLQHDGDHLRPGTSMRIKLLPRTGKRVSLNGRETSTKRITVEPTVCQGQPCVRGLRIPVSLVLKYLADGRTSAEIVDEFPELELEDIGECLRYAAWLASGRAFALPPAA